MDREPLLPDDECTSRARRVPRDYVLTAYEYPKGDGYRREKERYCGAQRIYRYYTEERCERRHSSSSFAKLLLVCIVCVSFLLLMYIPVYNKVNTTMATVSGWTASSNRDTKVYVQPRNITLVTDVKNVCPDPSEREVEPLFLLIIVCSSTVNFKERQVIRETWASYANFVAMYKARNAAREKYKDYKFDYDLIVDEDKNLTDKDKLNEKFSKDSKAQTNNEILHREKKNVDVTSKNVNEILKTENVISEDLEVNHTDVRLISKYLNNHPHVNGLIENVHNRRKRNINLSNLLPHLAAVLKKNNIHTEKFNKEPETTDEVRFEDDQKVLPEFEMDKVLGEERGEDLSLDYDEESNVMKIPPRGFEESPDLDKVMTLLKKSQLFLNGSTLKGDNKLDRNKLSADKPVFKVLFLVGLPSGDNDTEVQIGIDEESSAYSDVIQESFIDSYNNLTLKSIMMLKWVTTHCDKKVRYVLKSDDDVFVNMPKLVSTLQAKAEKFKNSHIIFDQNAKEYFIMGSLIRNARPVLDTQSKWYSPHYMYAGRIYPRYLSGTAYLMTESAVAPLYKAALRTPLFHLEDVFITGMCAARASPRIQPQSEESFSYLAPPVVPDTNCVAYSRSTVHRASAAVMRASVRSLADHNAAMRCERMVLQRKRVEKLNKLNSARMKKIGNSLARFHSIFN